METNNLIINLEKEIINEFIPEILSNSIIYDYLMIFFISSLRNPKEKILHQNKIKKILLHYYYFWDKKMFHITHSNKLRNREIGQYLFDLFEILIMQTYQKHIANETGRNL